MPYGKYQNLPLSERLVMMLEATQAGTWEWNVQTGETYFNARWAETFGYRLEELEPISIATWTKFIHPNDRKISDKVLKEHFAGKRDFYECEVRMRHKEGHWVWIRDYGKLVSKTREGKPEWVVGTHIDITRLKELSERFEVFADLLPGVVYQFQQYPNGRSRFPFASQGLRQIYGVDPEDVKEDATAAFEVIHPDDVKRVKATITESARKGSYWICEYRVRHANETRWVFGHARPQSGIDGSTLWYGMIIDISQRKTLELALQKSQANLKLAQHVARTGHWELNKQTGELYWSDMVYKILGYQPGEIEPSVAFFNSLVPAEDLKAVRESEEGALVSGIHDVQHRMRTRSGHYIWVHELAELQQDGHTLIGTVRDITEQKDLELQLQQQAINDPLTQIGNRRFFQHAMEREFRRFKRYHSNLCLITFDLDHFKQINDTYGHAAGDKVLIAAADAVKNALRAQDVFARVGGEEFAILLPAVDLSEAQRVADKLKLTIEQLEIHEQDEQIPVTATFGLVKATADVSNEEHFQQIADRALYKGKMLGRNQVYLADQSLY